VAVLKQKRILSALLFVVFLMISGCGTSGTVSQSPAPDVSATPTNEIVESPSAMLDVAESPTPMPESSADTATPTATGTSAPTTATTVPPTQQSTTATATKAPTAQQTQKPNATATPSPKQPTVPPVATPTIKPPTPTPTKTSLPGIGYTDEFVYAPDAFLDALLVGLNNSRRIQGTEPITRDRSGSFYKRAEEQAKKSALAGRPVHSVPMDGNESIASYPYYLDWSAGQQYGAQAAMHAPNLMADGFSQVGICAIAYKSEIYVVFYSTDWPF